MLTIGHRERTRGTARRALQATAALSVALGIAACGASGLARGAGGPAGGAVVTSSRAPAARAAGPVTRGRFVLLGGRETTLRAFAGQPLMVWFVENGCASCAVSIPAVARHLSAFAAARVRVLVLGIYGAFGQGSLARAELASFGRSAAGRRFADPAWTWGLASARLTGAFDPSGTPDEYFLLNRTGRVVYQGATPVSTMGSLLSHLKEIE